jgi:glycosyltransferase involved in cell wall biosynthesis
MERPFWARWTGPRGLARSRHAARGRPLGVAMVTALFPPSIGGIQSHTLLLSRELARRGLAVHVVTRTHPGLPTLARLDGFEVHRVGAPAAAPGAVGSAAFIVAAARRVIALRDAVDVVHAHQLLSPTTAGLLSAPLVGLPLVVNPHACGDIGDVGVLSRTAVGRLRLAATVRRADAFVAVSGAIRDELVRAGAPPGAISRVSNGVDTARFRPAAGGERLALRAALGLGEDRARLLVTYVGRLAPEKGVDVLVDAWPSVAARTPARLLIVGQGAEEAGLRLRARALGVADSVRFTGGVADAAPLLRAADASVLPSRSEGMPLSLLEAMACGLPVIATGVGGSLEVLGGGGLGLLVPPERPEALAAAMARVLGDPALRGRLGRAARAHVLEHHALDLVVDRLVALYRALAAQRGRGAGHAETRDSPR